MFRFIFIHADSSKIQPSQNQQILFEVDSSAHFLKNYFSHKILKQNKSKVKFLNCLLRPANSQTPKNMRTHSSSQHRIYKQGGAFQEARSQQIIKDCEFLESVHKSDPVAVGTVRSQQIMNTSGPEQLNVQLKDEVWAGYLKKIHDCSVERRRRVFII